MAKYDYDFKKSVIELYQRGEGGYVVLVRRHGIPADSTVHKWVKIVEKLGFDSLNRRKNKQTYSFKFKQDVIHIAMNVNLTKILIILNGVFKIYRR